MNILNADYAFDSGVGVVVFEGEVFVLEFENIFDIGIDAHLRQFARFAGELQMHLVKVVEVDMRIACCVNEIAWLEVANLRHHHAKQSV